eukprot:TRINITY_DN2248_c0_g1_i1.p2 TRINITY_DN2248_c0_g1~~TRINITY_DN2248_c0_g1_i1.p2  ORF type:complete len:140 (+),score=22.07 TRINITY_DN2248_c0_g1_i1:910-1329(+)
MGHLQRWTAYPTAPDYATTVMFRWSKGTVEFWAYASFVTPTDAEDPSHGLGTPIAQFSFSSTDSVFSPGAEQVHLNLWLTKPQDGPSDGQPAAIVVRKFEFLAPSSGVAASSDDTSGASTVVACFALVILPWCAAAFML